jgi:penicillin-insensitive murein endopeptidase
MRAAVAEGLGLVALLSGCARAPSPLTPAWHGSIGTPNHGVLAGGAELPRESPGLKWLRNDDRHWAQPRLAGAVARAAARVAEARPGGTLRVGDVSVKTGGGPLPPHLSHRSGVDVDLLLYVSTLDGAPVDSPGFVHVGADGIARDDGGGRWLRLDVEREWLLVEALVEDAEARVQWLFVSDVVQALLVEWALARGESIETVRRAREVMLQPRPGGIHDDHIHLRIACSPEEAVAGCEPMGPRRAWLDYSLAGTEERVEDLAQALLAPLAPPPALAVQSP